MVVGRQFQGNQKGSGMVDCRDRRREINSAFAGTCEMRPGQEQWQDVDVVGLGVCWRSCQTPLLTVDVARERKGGNRDDLQGLGLSSWRNRVAIN